MSSRILAPSSGGNRGSRNAAAIAFSRTSTPSGRRRSSEPMQPRSSPACFSVTNVAAGVGQRGMIRRGGSAEAELRADRRARDREQHAAEISVGHRCGPVPRRRTTRSRRRAPCRPRCRPNCAGREAPRIEPAATRRHEEAVDRRRAARLLVIERCRQREDRIAGGAIGPARVGVAMIVRQVGAHDDERLRASPEEVDDFAHLVRRRVADGEGHDAEIVEDGLQERKLHFERVLVRVRRVARRDLRQRQRIGDGGTIDGDVAHRRRERLDRRQREPADRHAMRRAEQHDAPDRLAAGREARVRRGGDRPRIDEPGMRHDDRLGRRAAPRSRRNSTRARCARTSDASAERAPG